MYIPFHILFYYDLSQDIEYSSLCYTEEGFPGGSVVKKSAYSAVDCLQCRRCRFDPWVGKIPWRRKLQPTPVFLHGKSRGWRSLAGHSPGVSRVGHDLVINHHHYAEELLSIYSAYNSLHLLTSSSQSFPPPAPTPLATKFSSLCESVCVL